MSSFNSFLTFLLFKLIMMLIYYENQNTHLLQVEIGRKKKILLSKVNS